MRKNDQFVANGNLVQRNIFQLLHPISDELSAASVSPGNPKSKRPAVWQIAQALPRLKASTQ
jgi:hypothetical protein